MSRFNDEVLEVSSFNQAVGIAAVIQGLQHERFRDSLIKHPTATFNEVNDRSLKFIITEEYALSQKPILPKNQNPNWRDEGQSRKRMKTTQNRGPMSTSIVRFGKPNSLPPQQNISKAPVTWISFNLPRSQIFMQIKNKIDLRQPRPMRSFAATRDHTRYYDFHQDHGHTTEQCNSLRYELESLAQKGMLNEYIQRFEQSKFGSAPNIMYFHCFESLGLDPSLLQRYDGPIYGFNNQPTQVEGVLIFNVAFGSGRAYVTFSNRFLVVKMASFFNAVIGQPTLTEIRAVVSQSHLYMKFPTPMGISTLRGNQEVSRHCYITSVTRPQKGKDQTPETIPQQVHDSQQVMGVEIVDNRPEDETRATLVKDVEEVQIDDRDPNRKTQIGTRTSADMPRIPTSVIKEEVENLLQAGFVRRVDYCEWVANPVLVKKANGKWQMCIDYTNLNQACPKDCYPMPSIDKLVEAAFGNERLSLLDVYSGYHLVPMALEDEEKISFYTVDEIYCYVMMPFGLKNAVKSLKVEYHPAYLDETFNNLKKNRMQLNPAKCIFNCLNPYETEYALREVYEGVCGSHIGARTLAHKVLRQGYYWPNMYKDATHFVQRCLKCQFFAHLTHQPAEELTNLVALWPFAQWGLDLLGPFMKGIGGVTHLIVGVDYFTKWVEAQPLSSLTSRKVKDFVFGSIIYRYAIPNPIVADNGIKPRLEQHKARWADELNNILWAYRTMCRTATGETSYHLAFGTEAVIPIEIGVPSFKVTHVDEGRNGQLLRENLDLLAEAGLTRFETRFGKLAPNWEGPYTVAEVLHLGAYILQDAEGK
ncbi:hypothetical protein SLEP1_g22565 [Rubroshorea leprosula]|uniref:Integrase catalytic domain-containing protein n=1 Tax=Rubroshorea leprosula TaxID=152421 RepID=A0AAV5JGW7_9ROSI|nr:hypothetical protein SLEP1_g22565 [Rubroshorea leprosula]